MIPKRDYSARRLIDTSGEKFQSSLGLQRWAATQNLKIAAQSYNEVGSLAELERKIAVKTEAGKSAKQSVVELEHRMKDLWFCIRLQCLDFSRACEKISVNSTL